MKTKNMFPHIEFWNLPGFGKSEEMMKINTQKVVEFIHTLKKTKKPPEQDKKILTVAEEITRLNPKQNDIISLYDWDLNILLFTGHREEMNIFKSEMKKIVKHTTFIYRAQTGSREYCIYS